MGWPMLARCTRIWWVRPVAMAMVASVRPRSRSAPVMRVTAERARRARVEIFCRLTGSRPSGGVDAPAAVQQTPRQPQVLLVDLAVRELTRQLGVGGVVLGDDHHPGRAAVEAVHDAGALLAADAAQPRDVVQQGVHQGSAVVPGRGVDHHAGRLVDHRQVGVVVQDGQRQRFRRRRRRHRGGHLQIDHVAGVHGMARPHRLPVQEDVALPDQPLYLRPRSLGHDGGHEVVEARAVVRVGDLQTLGVRGGRRQGSLARHAWSRGRLAARWRLGSRRRPRGCRGGAGSRHGFYVLVRGPGAPAPAPRRPR